MIKKILASVKNTREGKLWTQRGGGGGGGDACKIGIRLGAVAPTTLLHRAFIISQTCLLHIFLQYVVFVTLKSFYCT